MFKDYYRILEISKNANEKEIKKAFRVQAIKWHPDRNQGEDTTIRMQEINEAYLILKDREARERYDIEYQKFVQYQQAKSKSENPNSTSKKDEEYYEHQNRKNSRSENKYSDYKVQDDLLAKWMKNAKNQAVELAKQTIKDFKGVSKAAGIGFKNGIIQLGIWVVFANLIYLLIRSCNN